MKLANARFALLPILLLEASQAYAAINTGDLSPSDVEAFLAESDGHVSMLSGWGEPWLTFAKVPLTAMQFDLNL